MTQKATVVEVKKVEVPVVIEKISTEEDSVPIYLVRAGTATQSDIPENYAYLISNKGMFIKRENVLYSSLSKVDKIPGLGDADGSTITYDATIRLPKEMFLEIDRLFGEIYRKFSSEAVVLLYRADSGKWAFQIPEQTVASASADYTAAKKSVFVVEDDLDNYLPALPEIKNSTWRQLGTIHSHASMSAFHSGTDDKDEYNNDGIHITIGSFNSPIHSYACRWMFGSTTVKKEIKEVVEGWEDTKQAEDLYPTEIMSLIKKTVPAAVTTYNQYGAGYQVVRGGGEAGGGLTKVQQTLLDECNAGDDGVVLHPGY